MAIGDDTLTIARQYRIRIGRLVDQESVRLVQAWARAWDQIAAEWEASILEILSAGDQPTLAQVRRLTRANNAMRATVRELDALVADLRLNITNAAGEIVNLTSIYEPRLIATQYPPGTVTAIAFDRVDQKALASIVKRTTQQVTALTRPLTAEATDAMLRELVGGITGGRSPREVARRMLKDVEGRFNGGLARALNVSRTELLDAYRGAAQAHHAANGDVLDGWIWSARLDTRCCPSCWAQHGTLHPLSEPGPLDHQQGRCARVPKTKSWEALGFTMAEPRDIVPDARTTFAGLPEADQLKIMGQTRLDGLRDGTIQWGDLSSRRTVDGWRDSYGVTPLKNLAA